MVGDPLEEILAFFSRTTVDVPRVEIIVRLNKKKNKRVYRLAVIPFLA